MGRTKTLINWYGDEIEKRLMDELERTYKTEADKISRKAASLAPLGPTGELSRSIGWEHIRTKSAVKAWVGILRGSESIDYARRIEFGFNYTSKDLRDDSLGRTPIQEPQPFLMPSLRLSRGEIMRALRKTGEAIAKARYRKGVASVVS